MVFTEQYIYQTLEEVTRNNEEDVGVLSCKSKFYQLTIKFLSCGTYENLLELALNKT